MINKKVFYTVLLVCWFIADIIATTIPNSSIPMEYILGYDKLLHIIKFVAFMIILYRFLHYSDIKYTYKLTIYIVLLLFPFVDEGIQRFIPSRSYSVWDLLADYIGIFIGLLLNVGIRIYYDKKSVLK